jgi:alkylated DNA repair protein (DNA oxidative demethylase)
VFYAAPMTQRPAGRTNWAALRARAAGRAERPTSERGLSYDPRFLTASDRAEIVAWLSTIHPIWEDRFSPHHPPPPGQSQRRLLRPVYWLGNWQFACLGYYHPPRGVHGRCVAAEPFPPVLARLAKESERRTRDLLRPEDIPAGWKLNTCLVNFYGDRLEGDRRIDTARVGEHKDFEPGPVASLSLGERAFFQFVSSRRPGERDDVVVQQWLEDGSLQLFGGARFKDALFHRVQRVDRRGGFRFPLHEEGFETRRVNFTFRYVPDAHVVPLRQLPADDRDDVRGYVETLAQNSPWFAKALAAE